MKRHLIIPLQHQQQQQQQQLQQQQLQLLHHHSFLDRNIAILGHCLPLMNNRDGDREAKRQKLDKGQEKCQQPPSLSLALANSKAATVQEELHRMDILSSAAVMFSTRDLIPKLFDAKLQQQQEQQQRENESRSSSNDALASAQRQQDQQQDQQRQQDQEEDQDNNNNKSAPAPNNTPFVLGPASRRTSRSRSVSLCDDDAYKSYQMELPPSVSRSLKNCNLCYKRSENINNNNSHNNNNMAAAAAAAAPNHLRRCPIHRLPSPPRLPRPEEAAAMIAPLSVPGTERSNPGLLFLSTRIYGGIIKPFAEHEGGTIRIIN